MTMELLKSLSLSSRLTELASGRIGEVLPDFEAPAENYGYPPALVPLWSESSGPTYVGYWYLPADLPRSPTFVRSHVENGYRVDEIARTEEQLYYILALRRVCLDDGIRSVTRVLATKLGLVDLDAVNEISLVSGDDLRGLVNHRAFSSDPPRACEPPAADYHGDFPTNGTQGEALRYVAGLEIDNSTMNSKAPWLGEAHPPDIFRRLLAEEGVGLAWLALNSRGWQFSEAGRALKDLIDISADKKLKAVAHEWIQKCEGLQGGY